MSSLCGLFSTTLLLGFVFFFNFVLSVGDFTIENSSQTYCQNAVYCCWVQEGCHEEKREKIHSVKKYIRLHSGMSYSGADHEFNVKESAIYITYVIFTQTNKKICPGWYGSVDCVPACELKGHWLNSQSGHMPGFWAGSPLGSVWEATHWCICSKSMFLSLSSPLSKNIQIKSLKKHKTKLYIDQLMTISWPEVFRNPTMYFA